MEWNQNIYGSAGWVLVHHEPCGVRFSRIELWIFNRHLAGNLLYLEIARSRELLEGINSQYEGFYVVIFAHFVKKTVGSY